MKNENYTGTELYGHCWRTADCVCPSTHSGPCIPKEQLSQCGFRDRRSGLRCELTEGHEAVHQRRTGMRDHNPGFMFPEQWEVLGAPEGWRGDPHAIHELRKPRQR